MQSTTLNMEQLLDGELIAQARKTIQHLEIENLPKAAPKAPALSEAREKSIAVGSKSSSSREKSLKENILSDLIDLLAKTLRLKSSQIDGDENIVNYGVDSIAITEYINKLSQKYQITLSATILFEERNLSGLADILSTRFREKIAPVYEVDNKNKLFVDNDSHDSAVFDEGYFNLEKEWLREYAALLDAQETETGFSEAEKNNGTSTSNAIEETIIGSSVLLLNSKSLPASEFVVVGQGDPLIFIPGIYANAVSFKNQINALKSSYRCYIYHPPGHGNSELTDSTSSLGEIVDHLRESLGLLGVHNNMIFIAWSLGASISLEFSIKYPEALKKLILIGGTASNITMGENAEFNNLPEDKRLEFISNMPKFTPQFVDVYSKMFESWNCEEGCKSITAETLLVHGNKDSVVDIERSDILNGLIPKCRREVIDGAGHLIPLTHSEKLNSFIEEFLK